MIISSSQNRFAKKGTSTKQKTNTSSDKNSNNTKYALRMILPTVQLIISAVLVYFLVDSGMLPDKYIMYISLALLLMSVLTYGLAIIKNKASLVISIILSVIIILVDGVGIYSLNKANSLINSFTDLDDLQIDNMIVTVKADDPAEEIEDARDYVFGYQNITDVENTQEMIDEIETQVGSEISVIEYDSIIELANALMEGKIHAAIYNDAFDMIIDDEVENYVDSVKIIYRHEIIVAVTPSPTPKPEEVKEPVVSTEEVDHCFSIYLSGIDTTGSLSNRSRSDVNLIMTVNTETKKILLTTTPRDTYIYIPGVSGNTRDKLTHAGLYGPETSLATLEQLYDIDIDYYARVNFTSFEDIIDAIGGVEVNSDYSFSSRGHSFSKGINYLDGAAALVFARERYSFSAGDNQRGKNQQALIEAIIGKLTEPSSLLNFNALFDSISSCVQTNMPIEDITDLVKMQLEDGTSWSVESVQLTGTGSTEYCYALGMRAYVMWVDDNSVADIISKMEAIIAGE